MTLGAILMLGGVTGAGAEDVSSLWSGSGLSGFDGALPNLPQNWADLPFHLTASQSVQYNSNLFNTPTFTNGVVNPFVGNLQPVGGFVSMTNLSFSTLFRVYQQEFFADATYGLYRYLNQASQNRAHNSADIGMNWVAGKRCTGRLIFAASSQPSAPGEQVGVNVINTVTTKSFNETANCIITGNWSATLNSGYSKSTNTATLDESNNFQNVFVAAGINYSVTQTNTLSLLATVSHYNYPDRLAALQNELSALNDLAALNTLPFLASAITLEQVNLSYTKEINPNLSFIASAGLSATTSSGAGSSLSNAGGFSGLEPQFTLSGKWLITPKMTLTGTVGRVVTPPTGTIGNVQTNETASVTLSYALTPKVSVSAGASINRLTSGVGTNPSPLLQTLFPNLTQSRNYGFNAGLNYAITPFTTASLTYQYSDRRQPDEATTNNIVMLALTYSPR